MWTQISRVLFQWFLNLNFTHSICGHAREREEEFTMREKFALALILSEHTRPQCGRQLTRKDEAETPAKTLVAELCTYSALSIPPKKRQSITLNENYQRLSALVVV